MLRRLTLTFTFAALPLAAALGALQAGRDAPKRVAAAAPAASGLDLRAINRAADPCVDFYQYACGGWIADNPIPPDQARWGRFDELQERNYGILRKILESAASAGEAATRKIGDYYASCMDEAAIERKGVSPLEPLLAKIAALNGGGGLPDLVADLHALAVPAFFTLQAISDFKDAKTLIATLDQGGLGLPDRDYYFRPDAASADIRGQYADHIATLAALAGSPMPPALSAAAVMRTETALAKAALDNVSRRDPSKLYHKTTPAELQALAPGFDWTHYFERAGTPLAGGVNVAEPGFFKALSDLLATAPLEDLKAYLRWQVVHANAFLLSARFADEHFEFYSGTLRGITEQRPRWKRCVQYTDGDLGEALGQAFVAETFGPRAKSEMLALVRELESALARNLETLPWMTDATKQQALAKLRSISNKIGYPDEWRDYGALEILRGDAVGNSHRANAFNFRREMRKIGAPLNKAEWSMTPPTVNAYYNPFENNINFPAGILQPPFFGDGRDPAVNFGGAGAVIGHELTHGFDDQGRSFDENGNLRDWWTDADGQAFVERAACFVDQYAGYTAIDDVKLNGKLTLGENTADNGGLRMALMAYLASSARQEPRTLDGFTPEQRVFMSWGQIWCESRRPAYERLQAQTNPHAPARYRVNGVVSNMPEFRKAFSCADDAPMVRATSCRVW